MSKVLDPLKARNNTKKALLKALAAKGMKEKYYIDQVTEYMRYYDDLARLNAALDGDNEDNYDDEEESKGKKATYIDILKEKRQVTKEMRNILAFLGLKPPASDGNFGGGGNEEL